MKADEIITKAEAFALSFKALLLDKSEQPSKKQTFLMDNQEVLHKYLDALQKIASSTSTSGDEEVNEDIAVLIKRAEEITTMMKETLAEYQKELLISGDTLEEETTAVLTEETIKEAMKTNKTTQEITSNMAAIAKEQTMPKTSLYNHMLVCDGQSYFLYAADKVSLETQVNNVVNGGAYADIQLFEVNFKPIPLKKKTIITL